MVSRPPAWHVALALAMQCHVGKLDRSQHNLDVKTLHELVEDARERIVAGDHNIPEEVGEGGGGGSATACSSRGSACMRVRGYAPAATYLKGSPGLYSGCFTT